MSSLTTLIQQVNSLIAWKNAVEANSKTTDELEVMDPVDLTSLIRVWNGSSKKLELNQLAGNINITIRSSGPIDWSQGADPVNEQLEVNIDSGPEFVVTGKQLLAIAVYKYTAAGFERHLYFSQSGAGIYGNGNGSPHFMLISITKPGQSEDPVRYNLGEIGSTAIHFYINSHGPYEITVGNTNIFTVLREGVEYSYLYQGNFGIIGVDQAQTVADDWFELSAENEQEPTEGLTEEDVKGTARQYTRQQNISPVTLSDAEVLQWNDLNTQQNAKVQLTEAVGQMRTINTDNFTNAVEEGNYSLTLTQSEEGGNEVDLTGFEDVVGVMDLRPGKISVITVKFTGVKYYAWITSLAESEIEDSTASGGIMETITADESGNAVLQKTCVVPAGVTNIPYPFAQDLGIEKLILPEGLISIGNWGFKGNLLTSIDIPETVTSIGSNAFRDNLLTSIIIPESVTSIGNTAFQGNNLSSVVLPEGLTTIAYNTFYDNSLTNVIIPSTVTNIASGAFRLNQITEVDVPVGCTVASDAFDTGVTINYV